MSLSGLHRVEDLRERQEMVRKWMQRGGAAVGESIFDFGRVDPAVYAASCESLIGAVTVPVGLVGTRQVLPMGSMTLRPGKVTLRIGQPIDTRGLTIRDRHSLNSRFRAEVAELSGLPLEG